MTTKDRRLAALATELQTLKNRTGLPIELMEYLDIADTDLEARVTQNEADILELQTFSGVKLLLKATIDLVADTPTEMLWTETGGFDNGGWFDATSDETNVIIPVGVEHIEVHTGICWEASNNGFRRVDILVEGVSVSMSTTHSNSNSAPVGQFAGSGVIAVSAGDEISVLVEHDANSNLEVVDTGGLTWFSMHTA